MFDRAATCIASAALVAVVLGFGMSADLRAMGCPGSHGNATSVLCNGDDLFSSGAYLQNGSIRLVLGTSSIDTGDFSTTPATALYTFYSGSGCSPYRLKGLGNKIVLWDCNEEELASAYYESYDSGGYAKLLTDGCVYLYDSSDNNQGGGICSI